MARTLPMLPKCRLCVLLDLDHPRIGLGHFLDLALIRDRVIRVEGTPGGPQYSAVFESGINPNQSQSGSSVGHVFQADPSADNKVLPIVVGAMGKT